MPNRAFDLEYSTQFRKEMEYLKDHGIEPSYILKKAPYNITTYKYTKTPELFSLLSVFYGEETIIKKFKEILKNAKSIDDIDLKLLCSRRV